tara:strand:- start:183 stop:488 length:306 start_codon:yes stop_codon:yes gene_type:complete
MDNEQWRKRLAEHVQLFNRARERLRELEKEMVGEHVREALILLACERVTPAKEGAMGGELLWRERGVLASAERQVLIRFKRVDLVGLSRELCGALPCVGEA